MTNLSILQGFRSSQLTMEPYPHAVIENTLPDAIYAELAASYPSVETIFANAHRKRDASLQPNARYDLSAAEILANPSLTSRLWHDFVAYHTSQAFFDEVLDKLGPAIASTYPDLVPRMQHKAPGGRVRAGIRRRGDSRRECEIALDCQIGMNSPSTGGTSVIGPHIDNPKELFASLFYVKDERDRAVGGDIVLYRWKSDRIIGFYERRYVRDDQVEPFATVPYGPNRTVWVLNSLAAVHGVSARSASPYPRRLCNIIAEVYPTTPRLFDVARHQTDLSWSRRIADWLGRALKNPSDWRER